MTRCAHGSDGSRCSQCAQAANPSLVVRKVAQVGAELLVDGVPVRAVELPTSAPTTRLQRSRVRGGKATGRRV